MAVPRTNNELISDKVILKKCRTIEVILDQPMRNGFTLQTKQAGTFLVELDTLPECLVCRTDGYGTIRSYLRTLRWHLVCRTVRYQSVLRKAKCKLTSRIKLFSLENHWMTPHEPTPRVCVDQTKHVGYEICVTVREGPYVLCSIYI